MKLDAKFYGKIQKVKDDSIVPDDQYMVFLVKDAAFLSTLMFYRSECLRMGADNEHIDAVDRTIARAINWRSENYGLVKIPDAKGEKLLA